MVRNYKRFLITATVLLSCLTAALLGVEFYHEYCDLSGWDTVNGQRVYRDFHGEPVSGWQEIDGQLYYFGLNRNPHRGWLTSGEGTFYFTTDGTVHTGWLETEDGRYFFDDDGRMHTGRLDTPEGSYLFLDNGLLQTGWILIDGQQRYLAENGLPHTGWLEADGTRYYLDAEGIPHTGWLEADGKQYYFTEEGMLYTGWLARGEYDYYFTEDGAMATGPVQINGRTYYFTPKGIHVILVNRDNPVPEDYVMNLVEYLPYFDVDAACLDALDQMLQDCRDAGHSCGMNSAYRSIQQQQWILNARTSEYMATGLSYADAYAVTLRSVAIPGTSEHHLGLAVDIEGGSALQWLKEHCWEYGFIVRYLEGKTHITGIMYEPWHFRYVGVEVSMDMKDTGLCLEEYLGAYPVQT